MEKRRAGDWLNSYLRLTDHSEPPELFRKWVGVSVIAAALERKCWLTWGDDITDYPNFYIILIGPPGKARKGVAMRQGKKFLKDKDLDIRLGPNRTTPESLINDLSNCGKPAKYTDKNGKELIFLHNSLTVFSGELTVFLGDRDKKFMDDLTDLYDCEDDWEYRTKNQGQHHIDAPFLNLVGATTPRLIQTSLPQEVIGGGLTSRMIFVFCNEKGKTVPDPFPQPGSYETRQRLQGDLFDIAGMCGPFSFTEAFLDAYIEWYGNDGSSPTFDDEKFEYYFERKQTLTRKLSMIMSASRSNGMVIDEQDFFRALEWLEEVEKPMRGALRGFGRVPTSEVMSRIMREVSMMKETNYRYLLRKYHADLDLHEFQNILTALEKMGYITIYENTGKVVFNADFDLNSL